MAGSVLFIVLVLCWDGWIRGAHCFSFVMGWLDPCCSLFLFCDGMAGSVVLIVLVL